MESLTKLHAKYKQLDSSCPQDLSLRIHRSLSWLERASRETDDPDAGFIFHWIAFNCVYSEDLLKNQFTEREKFSDYFDKLMEKDADKLIYNLIWNIFSNEIRLILNNKYIFSPFWRFHNGEQDYSNWLTRYNHSIRIVKRALAETNTVIILETLFDRLYVLRNQLLHGGSTWNSSVNREQINNGHRIMAFLVPIFIDLMMDNPQVDWGKPIFPVVDAQS